MPSWAASTFLVTGSTMDPPAGTCSRTQFRSRSELSEPVSCSTVWVSLRSHTAWAWMMAWARSGSSRMATRKGPLGKWKTLEGFRAVAVAGKASPPNMAASAKLATGMMTARVGWAPGFSAQRVNWMAPSTSTKNPVQGSSSMNRMASGSSCLGRTRPCSRSRWAGCRDAKRGAWVQVGVAMSYRIAWVWGGKKIKQFIIE